MVLHSVVDVVTNSSTELFVQASNPELLRNRLLNALRALGFDNEDLDVRVWLEPAAPEFVLDWFVEFYQAQVAEFVLESDDFALVYSLWSAGSGAFSEFGKDMLELFADRYFGGWHEFLDDFSRRLLERMGDVYDHGCIWGCAIQYRVLVNDKDLSDLFLQDLFEAVEVDH